MPYINAVHRRECDLGISRLYEEVCHVFSGSSAPGVLNYLITRLCMMYIRKRGGISYGEIASVVGVLETVKLELYRRVASSYEDEKKKENGDIPEFEKADDERRDKKEQNV